MTFGQSTFFLFNNLEAIFDERDLKMEQKKLTVKCHWDIFVPVYNLQVNLSADFLEKFEKWKIELMSKKWKNAAKIILPNNFAEKTKKVSFVTPTIPEITESRKFVRKVKIKSKMQKDRRNFLQVGFFVFEKVKLRKLKRAEISVFVWKLRKFRKLFSVPDYFIKCASRFLTF